MRSAAGRTIWATRSAIPPRACACWPGGARSWKPCTQGRVQHPVFVALEGTAQKYDLADPALRRSDQRLRAGSDASRAIANWEELFDYCRCSANPVGRLVLRLCGYADAERDRLSDATCTALQLANFWQDVTVDFEKDRVYLPLDLSREARLHGGGSGRAQVQPGISSGDARSGGRGAQAFPGRPAAGQNSGPAPGVRSGTVQPRRHARARKDRAAELQRAGARGPPSPKSSACSLVAHALLRAAFTLV